MATVSSPRGGPTECCGALIYTVTHSGSFCAACDRKVYLWNGLLCTPERDEEMRRKIEQAVQPPLFVDVPIFELAEEKLMTWYIARCEFCTPLLNQPFSDETERDDWVDGHVEATGHAVTIFSETVSTG